MTGPLQGLRIIEFAGLGPGPFCGMMLADHGADVIRIERIGALINPADSLARSRRSIALDLKKPEAVEVARSICKAADGLIEGYRPGVMERLGLGPDVLLGDNPALVYGRMTGWGQYGPLAPTAGHDINYIAISGILDTIGEAGGRPIAPVNYLGDFGGGGMVLAFGMVSALLAVKSGGQGQVIDCAMTDGSALLSVMTWKEKNSGTWREERGTNRLDGGAPFYDTFVCADGKYIALGSLEPQFYARLRQALQLDEPLFDEQMDRPAWPEMKEKIAHIIQSKTRDEWCALMEDYDLCFSPILSLSEAPDHPHNAARQTFVKVGGDIQPAPAPRYSVTATADPMPPPRAGADTERILRDLGYEEAGIAALRKVGAVACVS